jgi:ribulose-phosphate 3-epimerase
MTNRLNVQINLSILSADLSNLKYEIERVAEVSDFLHLDIMDKKFVPNFTFDFETAREIIKFSPLQVDAHLMIENPDELAPKYAELGCYSVTFHLEAAKNPRVLIKNISANGSKVAVAISPGTDVDLVEEFLGEIHMLVIMTVEPGFGGQKFLLNQLPKIKKAREFCSAFSPAPILQVDGGISETTIAQAASSGANCFVVGSAIYGSESPADMVRKLRKIAETELARNSKK